MADRILCLTWGEVARGREARSLEVFNDALGYYSALKEQGRIDHFDVVLLSPNGALDGLMLLHGTHAQIDAIREDERFQRLTLDAGLVVDELRVIEGYVNEGVGEPMSRFQEAVGQLPQAAHV